MARIKYRKHGKEKGNRTPTTHIIKTGWTEKRQRKNGEGSFEMPTRLRGFVLCSENVGNDGNNIIDYALMAEIGFTDARSIDNAVEKNYKAPDNSLPTHLDFAICTNAQLKDGEWDYSGLYTESLEYYTKKDGRYCYGDGETAWRKEGDGTRRQIQCVPVGKTGAESCDFCQFSKKGDCKSKGQLVVMLLKQDANGNMLPLGRTVNLRFRYETTSDAVMEAILGELDKAASRVNGKLHGISGSLQFSFRRARKPDGGSTNVPRVSMILNEADIRNVEDEQRRMRLEDQSIQQGLITYEPEGNEAPEPTEPVSEAIEAEIDHDHDSEAAEMVEEVTPEVEPNGNLIDDLRSDTDALFAECEKFAEEADAKPSDIFSIMMSKDGKKNKLITSVDDLLTLVEGDDIMIAQCSNRVESALVAIKKGEVPGYEKAEVSK